LINKSKQWTCTHIPNVLGYCVKTSYPIFLQFNALFVIICITLFSPTMSMVFFMCSKTYSFGSSNLQENSMCWSHPTIWILCKKKPKCYDYFFIHVTPPIQDDFNDSRSFMSFHASSYKNVVCNYSFWIFMYHLFQLLQQSWSYSSMLECQQHGMEYWMNIHYLLKLFRFNVYLGRLSGLFIHLN